MLEVFNAPAKLEMTHRGSIYLLQGMERDGIQQPFISNVCHILRRLRP